MDAWRKRRGWKYIFQGWQWKAYSCWCFYIDGVLWWRLTRLCVLFFCWSRIFSRTCYKAAPRASLGNSRVFGSITDPFSMMVSTSVCSFFAHCAWSSPFTIFWSKAKGRDSLNSRMNSLTSATLWLRAFSYPWRPCDVGWSIDFYDSIKGDVSRYEKVFGTRNVQVDLFRQRTSCDSN